nr:MAG TPA: hypothetical protein [Caudoviricetes sp.]DAU10965.1 MAG TPA: hypothetical protein [Caudoviricetes sp.]
MRIKVTYCFLIVIKNNKLITNNVRDKNWVERK